jgi:hypothetical protein
VDHPSGLSRRQTANDAGRDVDGSTRRYRAGSNVFSKGLPFEQLENSSKQTSQAPFHMRKIENRTSSLPDYLTS